MDINYLLVVLLSAVSSAAILIIVTLGLSVIFGLMGVINLAHGEFIMFGAYSALSLTKAGIPFPISIFLAALLTALFGIIIEKLIIQRLYGRIIYTMLATWGLSMVMYQSAVLLFGTVTPGIDFSLSSIQMGEYSISSYLLIMIPIAIVLLFLIYYLLTKTKYGIMARASISDPTTSLAMGIQTKKLNMVTFALGSGIAGFAGAILLPIVSASPNMGFAFVIKSFLTVVVAGPLAVSGTAVAGASLGMITSTTASFYSSIIGDFLFFLITILVLRFFPLGISYKWKLKL
ncbi:MAG: ABC transporter permease subunit [Polaribacter sp.]